MYEELIPSFFNFIVTNAVFFQIAGKTDIFDHHRGPFIIRYLAQLNPHNSECLPNNEPPI